MKTIAHEDGKREAQIHGSAWKPDGITLCCYAAVTAMGIALLILWLMPLPTP